MTPNKDINNLSTDILEVADYSTYRIKKEVNKIKDTIDELKSRKIPECQNLINIRWSKLKLLRDTNKLVAGLLYRITDYVATTVQEGTTSANHPFDIIVTADNECTLNENARAILHDGDDYFANCDLTAWELKYCLDNDAERFIWADDGRVSSFCVRDDPYGDEYIEGGGKFVLYALLSDVISDIPYGNRITDQFPEGKYIWKSLNDYYYSYAITESEYFRQGSKVYYCESNGDSENFGYADNVEKYAEGGKGVIYYMKDEWNNECPYDFKGIKKNLFLQNVFIGTWDGEGVAAKREKQLDGQNNATIFYGEMAWLIKYTPLQYNDEGEVLPIELQIMDWGNDFEEVIYSESEDLYIYIETEYEPILIKHSGLVLVPTESPLYTFLNELSDDATLYGRSVNNKICPEFKDGVQIINRLKELPTCVCNYQNNIMLGSGLDSNEDGSVYIKTARKDRIGGIIVGDNLSVSEGVVSADVSVKQVQDLSEGIISSKIYEINEYPTFEAIDDCVIGITKYAAPYHNATVDIEFSIDYGPWHKCESTLLHVPSGITVCHINSGLKVRMRGSLKIDNLRFTLSGKVFLYGNLRLLLDKSGRGISVVSAFKDCTNLLSHPTKRIVIAQRPNDVYCELNSAFSGCSNMKVSPIIIANRISNSDCKSTFAGCSSLSRIDFFVKEVTGDFPVSFVEGLPLDGKFFTYSHLQLKQNEDTTNTKGYIPYNWEIHAKENIPPQNNLNLKLDSDHSYDDAQEGEIDTIYFTNDTHLIILNGKSYGSMFTLIKDLSEDSLDAYDISPNYKYLFGIRNKLTINLGEITNLDIVNHYMFEFTSGSTPTTLSLPASVKWATTPSIKANKTYLISIENNLGIIQEWE